MSQELKLLLLEKEYIDNITEDDEWGGFKFTFKLRNEDEISLIIVFDDYFPATLPLVLIDGTKSYIPKKPHILNGGFICYLDKEGIVWNDNPSIFLDLIFERVEDVLFENNDKIEYHREFNYYFSTLTDLRQALSLYDQGRDIEEISVYLGRKKQPLIFLKGDEESQRTFQNLMDKKASSLSNEKAIFIPLDKIYDGIMPQKDNFWDVDYISNLINSHLSVEKRERLETFTSNKNDYYYLLEIPLMTGSKVTIGLWYKKIKSKSIKSNPILNPNIREEFKVYPIYIFRYDNHSLVNRSSGVISDSKVLLIGAGSIGSDVLFSLARSGLKRFTIVDHDKLYMENSYRHFLGMNQAFKKEAKVKLLKEEMESRYPNIRIETLEENVLNLIKNKTIDFNQYNLIISAIGDPNIERVLNKLILETDTPAIFTWVEAYGIGGHTLLVNNSDKGCYECLFDKELNNYAAFADKSDKPYTKNINGCSGTFTPYGSMDSMQTALIASRLALKVINNEVTDNPLFSWRGDSEEFRKNGYETSPRYEKSLDDLQEGDINYIRENCKCCLKERNKDDN